MTLRSMSFLRLSPETRSLIIARALRAFIDGFICILLPAYLLALGLGAFEVAARPIPLRRRSKKKDHLNARSINGGGGVEWARWTSSNFRRANLPTCQTWRLVSRAKF
jgi:hypothetical protein